MNLLLLLSALLSALTGVQAGARGVQPTVSVARAAEAAATVAAVRVVSGARPVAAAPTAILVVEGATWRLLPITSLVGERRRE